MRVVRLNPAGLTARAFYDHVAGSNSSATAKAEARRNDRRRRRSGLAPPSVWIELITWDDRYRDQPQPVTVTALPNPFS
jgi:hypothetical protein